MVLVCAADDFQKISENAENELFFKKIILICHKQKSKYFGVFQVGWTGL